MTTEQRLRELSAAATASDEADTMCPNCVTPWKCNGPHLHTQTAAFIHDSELDRYLRNRAEQLADVVAAARALVKSPAVDGQSRITQRVVAWADLRAALAALDAIE